ncbi:uncharacterized protein FN964_011309 isoform 1-T1 [Alca torda]
MNDFVSWWKRKGCHTVAKPTGKSRARLLAALSRLLKVSVEQPLQRVVTGTPCLSPAAACRGEDELLFPTALGVTCSLGRRRGIHSRTVYLHMRIYETALPTPSSVYVDPHLHHQGRAQSRGQRRLQVLKANNCAVVVTYRAGTRLWLLGRQVEHPQLSQPVLTAEGLQPSENLHGLLWPRSNGSTSFCCWGPQSWTQNCRRVWLLAC